MQDINKKPDFFSCWMAKNGFIIALSDPLQVKVGNIFAG